MMEAVAQKRDNHTPSCAVCQRRKVKCDRRYPCAACTKSGLECLFSPAGRERKRARKNHHHLPDQIAKNIIGNDSNHDPHALNFGLIKPDPSSESNLNAYRLPAAMLQHAPLQPDLGRIDSLPENLSYHTDPMSDSTLSSAANANPAIATAHAPSFSGSLTSAATASVSGSVGASASASALPSPESTGASNNALLVPDGTGLRYVNNHLWSAISSEARVGAGSPATSPEDSRHSTGADDRSRNASLDDQAHTPESNVTGRNFLFGNSPLTSAAEDVMRIPASHIVFLWHTYLANVDPIMKISHPPAIQHVVLGQIGRPKIPPGELALVACIYLAAIVSLTEEICLEKLQDSRGSLIQKFRDAAEMHLSAANFVTTTDIGVLQALILYLGAMRSIGEIQMVWTIFGLAIRIAGTIGLARDGASFGLSPFETEMRRRLWWDIVYFDGRMAELVGQDGDLMGIEFDALPPSNFNDSDLFPSMKRLPEPRRSPTESTYLIARTLCCNSARSLHKCTSLSGTWSRLQDTALSTADKITIVERVERQFSEDIIETCDPTVPLQWLSINTVRTFASKLRLIARVPVIELDKEWEMADGYSENAFLLSIDLMQLQLELWEEPMVQPWRWHWQAHFQWYALVCLLRQTRLRRGGPGITKAWSLIRRAFEIIIPSLELGPRKSLLLEGIHGLLNAAKTQQDHQAITADGTCPPVGTPGASASGPFRPMTSFNSGYPGRSHTALTSGLDYAQPGPSDPFTRIETEGATPDPSLAFNLDGIDWVELDRLASELCQQ